MVMVMIEDKRYDNCCMNDRGKLTNIDYQTDWILKELKETNRLIKEQTKVNHLILRLFEHMLEKSDNPERMREAVRSEISRGLR